MKAYLTLFTLGLLTACGDKAGVAVMDAELTDETEQEDNSAQEGSWVEPEELVEQVEELQDECDDGIEEACEELEEVIEEAIEDIVEDSDLDEEKIDYIEDLAEECTDGELGCLRRAFRDL